MKSASDQDARHRTPPGPHDSRCTHNPKVAGSNPAPATKEMHVKKGSRLGEAPSALAAIYRGSTGRWGSGALDVGRTRLAVTLSGGQGASEKVEHFPVYLRTVSEKRGRVIAT